MKSTSTRVERWVRRAWGLPAGSGFYAEHPCKPRARRVPGYFTKDNDGTTRLHETSTWEEAHDEAARHRPPPPRARAGFGPLEDEPRERYDFQVHSKEQQLRVTSGGGLDEGSDDAARSVSLGEDIWHLLTVEMSLSRLLALEIFAEFLHIFLASLALVFVAACEGETIDGDVMTRKMLLSLTTVRIASDSIFGWQERTPSSHAEVCVLALLGWSHWLLLSVAGAVIVARALKPLQQVAFAPDCAWGADDVSFRLVLLRRSVILYDLQVRIQAFAGGRIFDLPLANGSTGYARWTGVFPLTFKHVFVDERSPLHGKSPDFITNIAVTVTAIDSDGKPVFANAEYYNPRSWVARRPEFLGGFDDGLTYPRILRGKWGDQFRMFSSPGDQGGGEEEGAASKTAKTEQKITGPPLFFLNMDNFHVINQEEPEDESPA